MAKGQKRSAREKKKPKKDTSKAAPVSSSSGSTLNKWKPEASRSGKKDA